MRQENKMQWGYGDPPNDPHSHFGDRQFGQTLNAINLAEAVRVGREFAEQVHGKSATFHTRPFSDDEYGKSIEDLSDDLRGLWAHQAGIHLRQQNAAITEDIAMYLEHGFGEPTVKLAFAAWLDRIKAHVMKGYSTESCS